MATRPFGGKLRNGKPFSTAVPKIGPFFFAFLFHFVGRSSWAGEPPKNEKSIVVRRANKKKNSQKVEEKKNADDLMDGPTHTHTHTHQFS